MAFNNKAACEKRCAYETRVMRIKAEDDPHTNHGPAVALAHQLAPRLASYQAHLVE